MAKIHTPDWVKDAVFYQVFPDRFAGSRTLPKPSKLEPWDAPPTFHGYKGGDLMGVVERLDYLQDLGITAIYFNPIFQSAANHRYHTYDYYQVDELLGGNGAFRTLLDEAHRRNIRVILDGVFNHASRGFYQFHHILENGANSPYVDWFVINGFPVNAYREDQAPNYAAWWNLHALPKFNIKTPAVREFLWDVARYWIDFGIDGWRLDVPEEINDPAFWQEFRQRVKTVNPEAYLVGEIWHPAPDWLQGDRFDAVMNYLFTKSCMGFFIEKAVDQELIRGMGYGPVPHLEVSEFANVIDKDLNLYEPEITYSLLNLLDSHDTVRFLTLARRDESALRLATLFQMTYPGAPCIYYGDEIGIDGGRDPDCRKAFPWDKGRWNLALHDFVRKCIALRNSYPALRRGEYRRLHAEDSVYAFGRRLGDETLIIALNVSRYVRAPEISVTGYLSDGFLIRDVWSGSMVKVDGGVLRDVKLPPRSGTVYISLPPFNQTVSSI